MYTFSRMLHIFPKIGLFLKIVFSTDNFSKQADKTIRGHFWEDMKRSRESKHKGKDFNSQWGGGVHAPSACDSLPAFT